MDIACAELTFADNANYPHLYKESTMKGDPQVIAALQAQLKNELTAINQYYMHYRMYKHWDWMHWPRLNTKNQSAR